MMVLQTSMTVEAIVKDCSLILKVYLSWFLWEMYLHRLVYLNYLFPIVGTVWEDYEIFSRCSIAERRLPLDMGFESL